MCDPPPKSPGSPVVCYNLFTYYAAFKAVRRGWQSVSAYRTGVGLPQGKAPGINATPLARRTTADSRGFSLPPRSEIRMPTGLDEASAPGRQIMDADEIRRALTRMFHEILERNHGADGLLLAGIRTRGRSHRGASGQAHQRLRRRVAVPVGHLDINLYRDDLSERPRLRGASPPPCRWTWPVVSWCCATTCSTPGAPSAPGWRPSAISAGPCASNWPRWWTGAHRELPIRPDFVGKNIPTRQSELVRVRLTETDSIDDVCILDRWVD